MFFPQGTRLLGHLPRSGSFVLCLIFSEYTTYLTTVIANNLAHIKSCHVLRSATRGQCWVVQRGDITILSGYCSRINHFRSVDSSVSTLSHASQLDTVTDHQGRTKRYKKLSLAGLGTIIVSFTVLAWIWCSSASYFGLIPVFFVGIGMAGLFTTQFVALSARSQGEHARTTITAHYLAQQFGYILGVTTSGTVVRTFFANDLRRSSPGVSEIERVRLRKIPTRITLF